MTNKVMIGVGIVALFALGGVIGAQIGKQPAHQKIEKPQSSASTQSSTQATSSSAATQSKADSATTVVVHNAYEAILQLKNFMKNDQLQYDYLASKAGMYEFSVHQPADKYIVYPNGDVKSETEVPDDAAKFDQNQSDLTTTTDTQPT
ncbi:MAG TPA: hypothetical protein VGM95_01885 [Lactobacillaceae bacterium]|jgi:hypothetical protein